MSAKHLKDKIVPVDPLYARTSNDLVSSFKHCSFQARNLAKALDVFENMCCDQDCIKILSLAGAMIPAGMTTVIVRLIEHSLVDAIVCTGATVSHDIFNIVSEDNQAHFLNTELSNDDLKKNQIGRVHDTYISRQAYERAEKKLTDILPEITYDEITDFNATISTSSFCHQLGLSLSGYGVLTMAAERGVSIFLPAVSDSDMGLDVVYANSKRILGDDMHVVFDTLNDIEMFGDLILSQHRAGLISIGGSVPRNWAQQIYPYLKMKEAGKEKKDEKRSPIPDGYHYSIKITDRFFSDGVRGDTFSKFQVSSDSESEVANVVCDATIALPFLVGALFDRLGIHGG